MHCLDSLLQVARRADDHELVVIPGVQRGDHIDAPCHVDPEGQVQVGADKVGHIACKEVCKGNYHLI